MSTVQVGGGVRGKGGESRSSDRNTLSMRAWVAMVGFLWVCVCWVCESWCQKVGIK